MKNKIKNMIILMTVTAIVFSMTACGSSDGDSKEKKAGGKSAIVIEPSELISKEEAESIMGVKFDEVILSEEPRVGMKICVYESEERMLQVTLTQQAFMPAGQKQTPENIYRNIKENIVADDATPVEGIGDEAYFAFPGIYILKDGYYIMISVAFYDENDTDRLKQAGKLAVKNLEARL